MTDETASPDGMTMEQAVPKLSAFFAAENGTPPERDNPPAETARAEESPTGDAAPQDTAPSGDEQKAEPAEQPPIAPPASWDADAKTRFAKLPREDQEYLIKRESDRDRELRRMQNETAERSKAFEAERAKLAQQLPPFQQQLAQLTAALNNQVMSEFADIKGPEDLARMAETDPARYVRFDARMRLLQQANQAQQQLRQQLGGDMFVLQASHLGEEPVGEDADVRLGQAGGGEDIDHLSFGGDRLRHQLAHGRIELLGSPGVVAAALLAQGRLQGLEEGDVIADGGGLVAGGAQGEGLG